MSKLSNMKINEEQNIYIASDCLLLKYLLIFKELLSQTLQLKSKDLTKPVLLETAFTRITIWCSVVGGFMQSERKNIFSLFC